MTEIIWDPQARKSLRKLPREISKRIFNKVDREIRFNVKRHLNFLKNIDSYKIRIGNYRLFADYYEKDDLLVIRSIRHRRNAYKKNK